MTRSPRTPVAILGAGLTGLSTSHHLGRAGVDHRFFERFGHAGGHAPHIPRRAAHAGTPLPLHAPACAILHALNAARVKARLSNDAGRYLCNAVYFQSLALRRERDEKRPTVFVHVPMPRVMAAAMPVARMRTPKPSLAQMAQALHAVIAVLARAARNCQTSDFYTFERAPELV